jgi:outer membrane protein TolC
MHSRSNSLSLCARLAATALLGCLTLLPIGCQSPASHRAARDQAAALRIAAAQTNVLGETEHIDVSEAADSLRRRLLLDQHLPHKALASRGVRDLASNAFWDPATHLATNVQADLVWTSGVERVTLTLLDALHVGAHSSRDFQEAKASLFSTALELDLEEDGFRRTFSSMLSGGVDHERVTGEDSDVARGSSDVGLSKQLLNGVELTSRIAVDLVEVLTSDAVSSFGLLTDASISIPLLRGAGKRVAAEGLTQAHRNMQYAVHTFERFKRGFAVEIISDYLGVLLQLQDLRNVQVNYVRLQAAAERAQRMAKAGRLPEVQYDQAVQDELRARTRWINAQQSYFRSLDDYKFSLGLPVDADVALDESEFETIRSLTNMISATDSELPDEAAEGTNTVDLVEMFSVDANHLVQMAISNRLDLMTALAQVEDAQRQVYIQADALRPEFTLLGNVQAGERQVSGSSDAAERADRDTLSLSGLLTFDLALERSSESRAYRESLLDLQSTVRSYQASEDGVKRDVRNGLRQLDGARENVKTQVKAIRLAEKRVRSTDLFLQAGRVEIRDVLEAEDALLSAQNGLNEALVRFRIAELSLQRDVGLLKVSASGISKESSL